MIHHSNKTNGPAFRGGPVPGTGKRNWRAGSGPRGALTELRHTLLVDRALVRDRRRTLLLALTDWDWDHWTNQSFRYSRSWKDCTKKPRQWMR